MKLDDESETPLNELRVLRQEKETLDTIRALCADMSMGCLETYGRIEELLEETAGKMNEYPKIVETIRVTLVVHCPKCSKRLDVDHVFTGEETDAAKYNILESVRNRLHDRLGGELLRRGWTVEMCGRCRDTAAPEAP